MSAVNTTVTRKLKSGDKLSVPCPQLVADYNKYMGGVDSHDQLRLQRYSLRMATKMTKYYKTLFLGLVDMALVNAYIIHRCHAQAKGEKPTSHADFFATLHAQLLGLRAVDFGGTVVGLDDDDEDDRGVFMIFV